MAFVFEMIYKAPHTYIRRFVEALAEEEGVDLSVVQSGEALTLMGDESDPKLAPFLRKLGELLPASLYMEGSGHRTVPGPVPRLQEEAVEPLPVSIGLCPRCMKEIFDPASRRYYYPFAMCGCCGFQYPFFEHYPYGRENTLMRFFAPCEACVEELAANPFRRDFPLVSCHECGIPVRMSEGRRERYANDPGSFKTLFEAAAGAVAKGKRVKVKTLAGWRLFFDAAQVEAEKKAMLLLDAAGATHYCALIEPERHALLSVERPLLYAAVADEGLRTLYGPTTPLKYPDEGFTLLLAKELRALGYGHVAFAPCDEETAADLVVDYDLALAFQPEMRLFVNKSVRFVAEGERGVFPQRRRGRGERVVVAHGMAAVPEGDGVLIDEMERFESAEATQLWLMEGEEVPLAHSDTRRFDQARASAMSVLVEHGLTRESAVACYFGDEPTFVYHNGKEPIVAVPPMVFDADALQERLRTLREGSDRLVANFAAKFPATAERLFGGGVGDIFDAAACIMALPESGLEAVGLEALKFHGKGGLQVDTKVRDNRFDPYAFVASLMSYRLAGVETPLLAFSIFESFGDYVSEIMTQLKTKAKADHLVLCGRAFGNPSLFSRVQQKLGAGTFLMNRAVPIDRENALLGALAL
ncbi:Kae1-like domain-containing protein [Hydrogenimonas sp.]